MRQGTASFFFGCHSPIHSILVILAWRKLYGSWPELWQVACIFLHDIGHIGVDYLDNDKDKERHWELGALIARHLFGIKGFYFLAGHSGSSGHQESALYRPDKYSWHIAPTWWLHWNNLVEPKLMVNCESSADAVRKFKAAVKENVESGEYRPTHSLYLERKYQS